MIKVLIYHHPTNSKYDCVLWMDYNGSLVWADIGNEPVRGIIHNISTFCKDNIRNISFFEWYI